MKRLVLLGGGHAHVGVLAALAARPLDGVEVTLVSPHARQLYSGMVPGWVAGHYPIEACAVALDALATRAGAAFRRTAAVGVDLRRGVVEPTDGGVAPPFDLLSIDTGPGAAAGRLPGSTEHALPVRPIEGFVARWPDVAARLAAAPQAVLAIVGAGAAGVELAFAARHRSIAEGRPQIRVVLVGSQALPFAGGPLPARRRLARLLRARGVEWLGGRRAVAVEPGRVVFDGAPPLDFDACLAATGAAAPAWPAAAGLAVDTRGFIRVDAALRSVSHPHIHAAGDVASHPASRPRSGVYAVRAGPVLAASLRAACEGRQPAPWAPQRHALYLLSTGDRHAVAAWGPFGWSGDWVWRWKDRIDRGFVRRFSAAG